MWKLEKYLKNPKDETGIFSFKIMKRSIPITLNLSEAIPGMVKSYPRMATGI
jgi:hypothetical protein